MRGCKNSETDRRRRLVINIADWDELARSTQVASAPYICVEKPYLGLGFSAGVLVDSAGEEELR